MMQFVSAMSTDYKYLLTNHWYWKEFDKEAGHSEKRIKKEWN